jgi:alkylation response protein AidB-like acyl-CoA dehydrogenase
MKYEMCFPKNKYVGAIVTDEEITLLDTIAKYVEREVFPKRKECEGGWYRDEELAENTLDELYEGLVKLGSQQINIPAKYGGLGGSNALRAAVNEELSRGDVGLATHAGKIHSLASYLVQAKREDLLERYVPLLLGEDCWTASLMITEPQGGANIEDPAQHGQTIRTRAELKGDEYIINGQKEWCGPAGPPELFVRPKLKGHLGYMLVATTDPSAGDDGIAVFHLPAETPGLTFSNPIQKMGMCYADRNCEAWLENVRVPRELRLAGPGQDVKILRTRMSGGRVSAAARCVGAAQAVFEIALDYLANRDIMGKSVREHSLWAAGLGELAAEIEGCRAHYLSVSWMLDHPEKYGPSWSQPILARASAARQRAGRVAIWVINRVIEYMGAYGYSYEYEVEKFLRDMKIVQLWLGGPQRDRLDTALAYYPFSWKP